MFVNLRNLLKSRGITVKEFGNLLDIAEKTAQLKLYGQNEFTLSEVKKIMILFKEYAFGFLFEKEEAEAGKAA